MSPLEFGTTFTLMTLAISSVLFIYGRRWAKSSPGHSIGQVLRQRVWSTSIGSVSALKSSSPIANGKQQQQQSSIVKQAANNATTQATRSKDPSQCGSPKQVHFAQMISTTSDEHLLPQSNGKRQHEVPMPILNGALKTMELNNNSAASQPQQERDELDSAAEICSPARTASVGSKKQKQTPKGNNLNQRKGTPNGSNSSSIPRKRHSSDSSQSQQASSQNGHPQQQQQECNTSGHLLKMIATSCLSKEDVGMAIETLLEKLESGETDWQAPKSDPMQRLRNQIRDIEQALATETQNHEQTRTRASELKQQVLLERTSKSSISEELSKFKKEFGSLTSAYERAHNELAKQQSLNEKYRQDSSQVVSQLKLENKQLKRLVEENSKTIPSKEFKEHNEETANKLRHQLDDKIDQLQRYEALNENLRKKLLDTEASLRGANVQLAQLRESKQHDQYEACAKIAELENHRISLERALNDQALRLDELTDANKVLQSSLAELHHTNGQQEILIRRLQEERQANESAMTQTLAEMEEELRRLHEQLSSKTKASHDNERIKRELNQFERELTDAGQREQRLKSKMKQLREGLCELFPDLRNTTTGLRNSGSAEVSAANSDDWVNQYLGALRQLTATVEEMRLKSSSSFVATKNGSTSTTTTSGRQTMSARSSIGDSPSKLVDKSTLTFYANGRMSPRVGSPTSNGRPSSRASNSSESGKRLVETKLVEDMALFCLRCLD